MGGRDGQAVEGGTSTGLIMRRAGKLMGATLDCRRRHGQAWQPGWCRR